MTAIEHSEAFGFTAEQAGAIVAELDRELGERRKHFPERVRKGDMLPEDADRRIGIVAEIRANMDTAFHPEPWTIPTSRHLIEQRFTWHAKVDELARAAEQRRRHYPDRVRKGDMTQADADRQLEAIALAHALYWRKGFAWEATTEQGRAYQAAIVARLAAGAAIMDHAAFADLADHPGRFLAIEENLAHLNHIAERDRQQEQPA